MFLGLDLGTTNVKAVVMDGEGTVVAQGAVGVERFHAEGGGIEQDIENIWQGACRAIRQALAGVDPAGIRAVGVSSQGGAVQLLDGAERPVGRVISWLDPRGQRWNEELTRRLGEEFFSAHVGHGSSAVAIGQILRLRHEQPELLRPPARIGFVGDCIVKRLCGRGAHDATSLSIAVLYNPSLRAADPEVLRVLGVGPDQLPDLLPPLAPAGVLGRQAGDATGLPAGIPVSAAVHDQYAAAVGAGGVRPGDVCLGTGTAWVLLAATDRLAPPVTPGAFVCQHLVDGVWGQLLSMCNGGSSVEWAMRLLGRGEPAVAKVDELAASAPPGSGGLCFRPLLGTCPTAGPLADRGGQLDGITFAHGPDHLVRAVLEGLACELARHVLILARAGVTVERLLLSGGAADSRVTPEILANVTGKPVTCLRRSAISAVGAAVLARAMIEGQTRLADLAVRLAPAGRTVLPDENATIYRRLLERYLEAFHGGPGGEQDS